MAHFFEPKEASMPRVIASVLLIGLCLVPGLSAAHSFRSLVVIGDSLSDSGRAYALSGGFYPASPPYAQRLSNGPVAAEYLAASLGFPLLPSSSPGGTNYAVGGATTGTKNVSWELDFPTGVQSIAALQNTGMTVQVNEFLTSGPLLNQATALYLVWGGPNDLVLANFTGGDVAAAAGAAVANLAGAVEALATLAGGQHFLVPNMVDLGQTPEFLGTDLQGPLRLLAEGFNAALADAMAQLEAGLDAAGLSVDITIFDTFGAFDAVLANPGAFGFTNTTEGCLDNLQAYLAGCPGYLFFDFTHPTTFTHEVLAQGMRAVTPPVPSLPAGVLVLMGAGLVALIGRRSRRTGL
jgi:phospholipase/lecithinase/hemolysin